MKVAGSVAALVVVGVLGGAGCGSSLKGDAAAGGRHTGRAADACSMLTSGQVEDVVGTSGPFTGAEEDAGEDGSPTWGCTWGTTQSYADVREITAARFAQLPGVEDFVVTPLHGIGDKALLERSKDDGGFPTVAFLAGGHYYRVEICVDRRELGTDHADFEAEAAKDLAGTMADMLG